MIRGTGPQNAPALEKTGLQARLGTRTCAARSRLAREPRCSRKRAFRYLICWLCVGADLLPQNVDPLGVGQTGHVTLTQGAPFISFPTLIELSSRWHALPSCCLPLSVSCALETLATLNL